MRLSLQADDFIWAGGIEDTFVPQARKGHRALDEYELMGHYGHWREDLLLARELGLRALRWGVPWYRVEPEPGLFDWRWTDEVLRYLVDELGITPIVDLIHYGCPFWLERGFAAKDYPRAVAGYAAAFAQRYAGMVRWYTPVNEPAVTALMCGRRSLWPPYLRGDGGYIRIMLQLMKGAIATVGAIKKIDLGAVMVHVEAVSVHRAAQEDLEALAVEDRQREYLSYDLLHGRVTPRHPLFPWLVRNGAAPGELADIARDRIELDVVGLNFYPQWSTRQLYLNRSGRLANRSWEPAGHGFAALVEDYARRYGAPVMITETSAAGSEDERARWLHASIAAVKQLREGGVPVVGYTWFPLFTMIDWRYRFGRLPAEAYRIELGLFTLGEGTQRWHATPLVTQYAHYAAHSVESIGHVAAPEDGARLAHLR